MGQTKTQRVIKQLSSGQVQKQTPIATDMFLPNHSGDHSAGIVNTTPTTDTDIANKKYVDDKEVESFPTSLTAGSVVFSDGTNLTEDNDKLFWDNTNNRLGIGTDAPATLLHIVSNTADRFRLERTSGGDSRINLLNTVGAWTFGIESNNDNFAIGEGLNFNNQFFTIKRTTGDIGIGTLSPNAKLDVSGSTFPVIQGVRTTTDTNNLRAAISVKRKTTNDMADGFGGGFAFSIEDSSGVSNGIAGVYAGRDGADDQGKLYFQVNEGDGATGSLKNGLVVNHNQNIGIGIDSPLHPLHLSLNGDYFSITDSGDGNKDRVRIGDGSGDGAYFALYNDASELTTLLRSYTSGDVQGYFLAGNIGIGMTDPHSKLEVGGAISSATKTFSTTGPTNNVDVSGVNTLFVNTASNNVTIGGFAGGVAGQYLQIVKTSYLNELTLEHNEGGGSQDLMMHQEADEIIDAGGVLMVCDGTDWWDVSHAKHV